MVNQSQDALKNFDPSFLVPGQSIDCVIIGYNEMGLHILVLKWKGMAGWILPGGFIGIGEDMDAAAVRVLEERTGLKLPYLKQFHTFGKVDRGNFNAELVEADMLPGRSSPIIQWLTQRFITTGYLSLVNMKESMPTPDFLTERCLWKPLNDLPDLMFDHRQIVQTAIAEIRNQINYMPVGINLLPEKFTMRELQSLYESILERALERSNFQKKILRLGYLNRHEKKMTGEAHKAPFLYSFDGDKYNQLLGQGLGFL